MSQNKYCKIAAFLSIYLISVVFAVVLRNRYHSNAEGNLLWLEIDKITSGFQFKQILASIVLFMVGYCIVVIICPAALEVSKLILSMPMGIVIWGLSSVILLIFRIPYNKVTAFTAFISFSGILLLVYRRRLAFIKSGNLLRAFLIVAVLANIFSTGYPRYTMTSDTHYYIYTYGRLITSVGKLSVESVGNLMETTGIMPALMSCFAVFCGFETIQIMHYILMTSLLVGLTVYLYKVFLNHQIVPYKCMILTLLFITTAISPLFLQYSLILSHSWMTAYTFLAVTLAEEVSGLEDKTARGNLICILSLFLAWMTLCRVEAIVTVVFLIVCMSYLKLTRREIMICSIPALIFGVIFHAENQILIAVDSIKLPYGNVFVTKSLLLMMAIVVVLMVGYIWLYERVWVKYLRRNMPQILLGTLLLASIAFCMKDIERTKNNFQCIFYNLTSLSERWYFFPFFVVIMLVLVMKCKREYGYWDMLVLGLILVFFCMSMGRIQPLRKGWGDSFNRYLLQMSPLVLVYLVKELAPQLTNRNLK